MAEMGINRGGFEAGAEFDTMPSGSQITPTKQRVLLKPRSSTKPPRLPMEPVPERLQSVHMLNKTAANWWERMTPQERAEASKQRSVNAKKQGKNRAIN